MERWAEPELPRDQIVLFPHRLDEVIPDDDPVRLLDQILRAVDWSPWEARYDRTVGRPPYHPRMVAAAVLHGLTLGVRASRKLEDACKNRVDFLWLVEGQTIDHSTFCGFIHRFSDDLADLFEQVVRLAMKLGLVNLNLVVLDGTRVRANSSRHATASWPCGCATSTPTRWSASKSPSTERSWTWRGLGFGRAEKLDPLLAPHAMVDLTQRVAILARTAEPGSSPPPPRLGPLRPPLARSDGFTLLLSHQGAHHDRRLDPRGEFLSA